MAHTKLRTSVFRLANKGWQNGGKSNRLSKKKKKRTRMEIRKYCRQTHILCFRPICDISLVFFSLCTKAIEIGNLRGIRWLLSFLYPAESILISVRILQCSEGEISDQFNNVYF